MANGSIRFQLNTDATVIASPYGQVSSNIPIVFQFDANGDIQSGAQLWSNKELNPQTVDGLGTWYLVSWFDQNGAQLSDPGVLWQFTQTNGSTVDIGTMTSISPTGPYYPFPFAGTGTVTSVALTVPSWLAVTGSPITTFGTLAVASATGLTNNEILATSGGSLSLRAMVLADLPATGTPSSSTFLRGDGTWSAVSGAAGGTVTSVSFTGDGILFTGSAGTPVTSTGTLTPSLITQSAHEFLAGPTSSSATPTFRAIDISDLFSADGVTTTKFLREDGTWAIPSASGTVNSGVATRIAYYASSGTAVSGDSLLTDDGTTLTYGGTGGVAGIIAANIPSLAASIITTGTLAIARGGTNASTTSANYGFMGPTSGGSAAPAFRALVSADIPNNAANTTGNAATATAASGLVSATTTVAVSAATAPTSGQVLTATSGTAATWQNASSGFANPMTTKGDVIIENATPSPDRLAIGSAGQVLTVGSSGLPEWDNSASGFANPMTTLGDIIIENSSPAPDRLAGNTTATKKFLTQTGTGSVSASPVWGTIAAADVPSLAASIITSGQIAIAQGGTGLASTSQNYAFIGPTSGSGAPSWRALVAGDMPARTGVISYVIDGGGSTPTASQSYGQIYIPVGCTVTGWVITADQSGSAVVDVLTGAYSAFPTVSSIASTDKPTLSSAQKNENLAVSVWTTSIAAGTFMQFYLDSVTTCTRINISVIVSIPYA